MRSRPRVPSNAALVAWVDIPPAGPNAADPDGEHWGVVVRSRGIPAWVAIVGSGKDGRWTSDDTALAERVRIELRTRASAIRGDMRPLGKGSGSRADFTPWSRNYAASASSRWPRPWERRPRVNRRPGR